MLLQVISVILRHWSLVLTRVPTVDLSSVLAIGDAWATALDRRQLLLSWIEGIYSVASPNSYYTALWSCIVIIYPGVKAEPILRDILLRQVSNTSIMLVAPTCITTTQFVSIARPVRMPACQKPLLIMLLTSLYLSKTFSLAVDDVLPSLIDATDIMAGTSTQVDIWQLQIVQKVGTEAFLIAANGLIKATMIQLGLDLPLQYISLRIWVRRWSIIGALHDIILAEADATTRIWFPIIGVYGWRERNRSRVAMVLAVLASHIALFIVLRQVLWGSHRFLHNAYLVAIGSTWAGGSRVR